MFFSIQKGSYTDMIHAQRISIIIAANILKQVLGRSRENN